jgi:cytochrome c551/c552
MAAGGMMKSVLAKQKTAAVLGVLLLAALLVSCAPNADEPILSPQLGSILAAQAAGEEITAPPTPTPVLLATLSDEQIYAGLPAEVIDVIALADPGRAESISLNAGCVGCHKLNPGEVGTGPTWHNVGDAAASRVPGESPAYYLYNSIVDPSAYVVPGFQDGIMPKTFSESLNTQDIADLIAFLLQQHQ